VARDDDSDEEQTGDGHEPRECMACRGTGRVISNLGGSPSTVECPWCGGSGQRQKGRDAQQRWLAREGGGEADVEPSDGAA
jgi:DnaJ-class molecular chaperone